MIWSMIQKSILSFAVLFALLTLIVSPLQAHHWHERVYVEDPWYHYGYVTPYGGVYYPVYYGKYPYYYYTPQYYYYETPPASINVNVHLSN